MPRIIDLRKKFQKQVQSPVKKEVLLANPAVQAESNKIKPLPKLSWEAPSFYYNPQKRYLAFVVIALFCGAGAMLFYQRDTLTAIFLILSSLVLILYANKKPTNSRIEVGPVGVRIDDQLYHYQELKSFWLDYNPGGPKELSLEAKKWYLPYVKVSIEDTNPLEIRSLMINFVPEREHESSLIDHIGKKLGL